jgi:hypothetical protein
MLVILGLLVLGIVVAILKTKRRAAGMLLPNFYEPIVETKVPVRDLKREAYVHANHFLTPRCRQTPRTTEMFHRKPFEVQSSV